MPKLKFERHNPDPEYVLQKILLAVTRKIKQKISEEGFKINPCVMDKLARLKSEMEEKHHLDIKAEEIMEKALEMVNEEQGGLPEKLQSDHEALIAKKIADSVSNGEDFYQAIGKEMVELKRKGVSSDSQRIEERVRKLVNQR